MPCRSKGKIAAALRGPSRGSFWIPPENEHFLAEFAQILAVLNFPLGISLLA